jgi:single-strand DNA-binding protein
MRTMNRVFLMGRLGQAPELMTSKNGRPYTRLSVATQRPKRTEDDKVIDHTDWHSVFVWGNQAQHCSNILRKGALVFVEGSMTYWQSSDDQSKLYKNAIQADHVEFLNNPRRLDNPEPSGNHESETMM